MQQTDFFKCLSDPTRLSIVQLVLQHGDICVCDLTEQLGMSQPKISRHLALLRTHGVLIDRRKGQWVYYRLHPNLPDWAKAICQTLHTVGALPVSQPNLSTTPLNPNFCE